MAMYRGCTPYGACATCEDLRPGGSRVPVPPELPGGPGLPGTPEPPPLVCAEPEFPWLWVLLGALAGYYYKE